MFLFCEKSGGELVHCRLLRCVGFGENTYGVELLGPGSRGGSPVSGLLSTLTLPMCPTPSLKMLLARSGQSRGGKRDGEQFTVPCDESSRDVWMRWGPSQKATGLTLLGLQTVADRECRTRAHP